MLKKIFVLVLVFLSINPCFAFKWENRKTGEKPYGVFVSKALPIDDNAKSLSIEEKKEYLDKLVFLGDKNLYNVCKNISNIDIEYVPYNIIDIYCEAEEFEGLAREIFNYCFENSIESEIYEDMDFDDVVDAFNNFGEKYCSVILTKNNEYAERFKKEVNSKFLYVNENPFKDENITVSAPLPSDFKNAKDDLLSTKNY